MVLYYAYSVEYGQYLTDTAALACAVGKNLGGLEYGPTDVHTFLSRNTSLVTTGQYRRVALTQETWQKKISSYGLTLEKISPIQEKIIKHKEKKSSPKIISEKSSTGTVTTRLVNGILIYDVIEEKIILTSRAVILDDSEDCSIIHFEKQDKYE